MAEMVSAELHFETVGGDLLGLPHHPGVGDQQVDAWVGRPQSVGGRAHRVERAEVEGLQGDVGAWAGGDDARQGGIALFQVAYREHDVRTTVGEYRGRLVSDAGVGAGDDNDATALIGHIGLRPLAVLGVVGGHGQKHTHPRRGPPGWRRASKRPCEGSDRSQIRSARRKVENVITGLAHTGVCVPDCEAAVAFYRDVLGLRVLSPPYVMSGNAIRDDMGELVSDPTMKAAIVGFGDDGDRVLEVIEYVNVDGGDQRTAAALTDHGISHVGLVCEDLDATRAELESKGVRFLVSGIADVARVRTTWFVDPWGVVFILVEKSRPERPYFAQGAEVNDA